MDQKDGELLAAGSLRSFDCAQMQSRRSALGHSSHLLAFVVVWKSIYRAIAVIAYPNPYPKSPDSFLETDPESTSFNRTSMLGMVSAEEVP